jgi:hypothetical protein
MNIFGRSKSPEDRKVTKWFVIGLILALGIYGMYYYFTTDVPPHLTGELNSVRNASIVTLIVGGALLYFWR